MKSLLAVAAIALAYLFASPAAHAAQSYDNCTNFISSVPATITTQGTWCFNKDLATSITTGNAITINANNVTLDCNDFKLGGLAAGINTQTVGIFSTNRSNLVVRNCAIRGFFKGMAIGSGTSSGHLIENNRIDNTTWVGLDIGGDGSVVRGNRIMDTGGTTVPANMIKAVGIYTDGDVEVLGNLINGVVAAVGTNGFAMAINPGNNLAGSIIDNNVKNVIANGTGYAYAVSFFGTTGRVSVDSNNFIGTGATNSVTIFCPESNFVAVAGNLASGWTAPMIACAYDDGNIVH